MAASRALFEDDEAMIESLKTAINWLSALLRFFTLTVGAFLVLLFPADRPEAGERADRCYDHPGGLLHLIAAQRREPQRRPQKRGPADRSEAPGGGRQGHSLAQSGIHRVTLHYPVDNLSDRLVDLSQC